MENVPRNVPRKEGNAESKEVSVREVHRVHGTLIKIVFSTPLNGREKRMARRARARARARVRY
jgi:hypothetical protein